MAKDCLTTNDKVFASRPKAMATELMGFNYANFSLAPYGPFWRGIRKIVLELVSHRCLQMLQNIRVFEVKSSITDMYRSWIRNKGSSEMVKVEMKQFGNLFLGGEESEDRFKKVIRRYVELLGAFVPSDAIPSLRWLDLGGYEKKMKETVKEIDVVIDGWLEKHKKTINYTQQVDESFMAAVLTRVEQELKEYRYGFSAHAIVKATCLAIFAAAATLTWALALLVNNPFVLKKSHQELEDHVGKERNIQESDLKNVVTPQFPNKDTNLKQV